MTALDIDNMETVMQRIIGAVLLCAVLAIGFHHPAVAAAEDYAFEAATAKVQASRDAIVSVRLIHKATGKPVADAVIFQTRLDMSPDNMGDMTAKITPLPSSEPGLYRFKADLSSMAGRWALKLAAKIPGEQETVRGEVIVAAGK